MNEFVLYSFLLFTVNKTNSSVRLLGESKVRQFAFWFYLTFSHFCVLSKKNSIERNFETQSPNLEVFSSLLDEDLLTIDSWVIDFLLWGVEIGLDFG